MRLIVKSLLLILSHIRGTNLKARCVRSSIVLGGASFGERGLRLVRNMVLARLLVPQDFGVMAIVIAASGIFEAFGEVGVRQSVIHNTRGAEAEYLNVAWWLQAVRSLGLFLVVFFIAPWIGLFYNKPELTLFLRIVFVAMVFNGIMSPRAYVLEKELQFGRWVFINYGSTILGSIFTITLALWIRNIWALVIGFTAEGLLRCLLSFILCPFWPRFRIDRVSLNELLRYARGMFGLTLITIVSMQIDVVVVGKVVSAEQLGMYVLALALARQPAGLLFKITGPVLLPAFAEKQDKKQNLCRIVLKAIRISFLIGVPVYVLLAIFSGQVLSVIYGSQYATVALPFGIMCIAMLVRMQGSILALVYQAIGTPHLHRRYVTLLIILIASLIYPGIRLFGLTGAAGVLLLSHTIAVYMQIIWMRGTIGLRFQDYMFCWLPTSWLNQ